MSLKSLKNQTLRNKSTINSVNLTGGASTGPVITSIIVTDSNYNNLDDTALLPAGGYAKLIGSGFASGCSAYFNGSSVTTTFVSATEVRVVIPATTAGTYNIMLFNPSTAGAIYLNLGISSAPTFTTTAGSLGTSYETTAVSTSIAATGDAPITYALYSGSLPTGVTLASNGTLSGTSPVEASSTTYSFVVQATDAQLQDTTRSFSLTISTDIVTWSTPAADFAYTLAGNEAMSNVSLSAASAAGYNITYAANTLPTGVSLSGNTIFGTPTVEQTVYTALTATAATTGRSATRYVSWSIALGDTYWKYNTLLIPGASTTFVDDASTNNFAVSIFGDTKPNSFNPYTPGYYSNYFDGTGDYLSTPNNAAFQFGTGDFTVECWVNKPTASNGAIVDVRATLTAVPWAFYVDASNYPYFYDGTSYTSTVAIVNNSWNHIVAVRTSGVLKIFVNGVQGYSASFTNTLNASGTLTIGGTAAYTTGYISNLRIVKGTAVYTTTFTPPTSPLTAIANTSLLTCQSNRFIDNSTNNFTLTVAGNTTVNSFDPFMPNSSYSTYGSTYFDGTGDYLSLAINSAFGFGTSDFTAEAWVYVTSTSADRCIFDWRLDNTTNSSTNGTLFIETGTAKLAYWNGSKYGGLGTSLLLNTWYHVAMSRQSGTTRVYLNGVLDIAIFISLDFGSTKPLGIGGNYSTGSSPFAGYITDVRVVKGTAVYTSAFTPPSAPLTAIANTSLLTLQNNQSVNNNVFLDNSTNNFLVTRAGNTTQGTFSPYGDNWSASLNGTTDYLSTPYNTAFDFNTGNFTVECWFNHTGASFANYPQLFGLATGSNSGRSYYFYIDPSGFLNFGMYPDGVNVTLLTATTACTRNVWNHAALVRSSGTTKIYLNGVVVATATNQNFQPYLNAGSFFNIGREASYNGSYFPGYISNFRIVKGTALYTTTFTPPTTPLTPITNTVLLTCQSSRFIDNSINNLTITKVGDTSVQRFSPFNPSSVTPTSYSGYFDGTGDYLSVAYNSAFNVAGGTFTIEAWVNITGTFPANVDGNRLGAIAVFGPATVSQGWEFNIDQTNNTLFFNAMGNGSNMVRCSYTFAQNTWYHIAMVRNGSTNYLFVNGISQTLTFNGYTGGSAGSGTLNVAAALKFANYNHYITGYISNFRIVNGTALYTSNFTPSTTPLTTTSQGATASQVSLLTLQSPTFIDNSTNNFTITAFGNSQPTIQNPFGYTSATTNGYSVSTIGGSGYFDGTGDYISVPDNVAFTMGSSNFTIECWVYLSTLSGSQILIGTCDSAGSQSSMSFVLNVNSGTPRIGVGYGSTVYLATAASAITANTWVHIAGVRNGAYVYVYVNGVQSTALNMGSLAINDSTQIVAIGRNGNYNGEYVTGYISDVRIVKGTALYTSNFVPPSAPLTAVQNTVLLNNMTSAGIYDAAMMNNLETVGDAKLSTAVSKFGGSSMSFDGSGDYLSLPSTSPLQFGSANFTIEFWLYLPTLPGTRTELVYLNGNTSGYAAIALQITTSNKLGLSISETGSSWKYDDTTGVGSALTAATWQFITVVRNGQNIQIYVNGTAQGSPYTTTASTTTLMTTYTLNQIGTYNSAYYYLNGYIDDLRITNGYARYTSNFTPPTSALQIK